MLKITLDDKAKIVRVFISGVLTVDEARKFHDDLDSLSDDVRRRHGRFALIADTGQAPVQPQEVVSVLPMPHDFIRAAQDRWAVLVGSMLARMQAERLLAHPQAKAFLTMTEAEHWIVQAAS